LKRIFKIVISTLSIYAVTATAQTLETPDDETGTSIFQSFKSSSLLLPLGSDGLGRAEARIQLSLATMFKASVFRDKFLLFKLDSPKVANIGLNYTQVSFDDLEEGSFPIVSTDYLPGIFLSLHSTDIAKYGFRQTVIGWEHQSNGEFEGQLNRGWDRAYVEVLFGYGRPFVKIDDVSAALINTEDNTNDKNIVGTVPFRRPGSDTVNIRLRSAAPFRISEENQDIDDFYGLLEVEATYRTDITFSGVSLSFGKERGSVTFEFSTKVIPILAHINRWADDKFKCQNPARVSLSQRSACIARYLVAPFDLKNNHGAWSLQYFEGYGDRIRDFDQRVSGPLRFGYRIGF